MNTIINATKTFRSASGQLETLCANQLGRPWYTSVEDFHTEASAVIRAAYEEQESQRQALLNTMATSADALVAMERKIGTGRVMRLAAASNIDSMVVMAMLNY